MPRSFGRSGLLLLGAVLSVALVTGAGLASADDGSSNAQIEPSKSDLESVLEGATENEKAPETNPGAAEELPHVDLERDEAEELLESVFPEQIETPAGMFDELDVEHFYSDHAAVVPPEEAGKPAGLLGSLIPLRVENGEGEKEVVDLGLEHVEGELQPANPIVELGVPTELGEGISLPETGVQITVAGAPAERAPSTVAESVAFYPNVADDTDLSVAPTPTGVETLTQIRSAEAPTTQTFQLSLPPGASLRSTSEGGAEVVGHGDKPLLTASHPTAMDAAGTPVPVALTVDGNAVTLTVSPGPDAQYPILVDPYWETYYWELNNSTEGLGDWLPASNSSLLVPFPRGINGEAGLNIIAFPGSIAAGSQANWNYHVPRYFSDFESVGQRPTSWIRSMSFTDLRWWNEEGQPFHSDPFFILGIWDEEHGWFAWDWVHTGLGGNLWNQSTEYRLPYNQGEFNPYKGVKMGGIALATSESESRPRHLLVGQATVEITDEDYPGVSKAEGPAKWQNQAPTEPITVREEDPGLGIYSTLGKTSGISGTGNQWEQNIGCFGNESHPCPRVWEGAFWSYSPAAMPQGIDYVEIIGKDPVWHFSDQHGTQAWAEVKVDHTPPTLTLSGPATEQASIGANRQSYELNINATDGTSGAPQSGVSEVKVLVDNKEQTPPQGWPKGCATQNCSFNGKWIFRANEFAAGNHTVKVTAFDAVGLASQTKSFSLALHPIAPPTISLSGTMTEQTTLGTTRPRYKLKVSGSVMGERLSPSDGAPFYLSSFGSAGSAEGQLAHPAGIAVDSKGDTWVVDQGNNRLEEFDPEGEYLTSIGSAGTGNGQFSSPKGVAVDGKGQIWVLDSGNSRVQKFNASGQFLAKFGSPGVGSGQMANPEGIAVDASGNVWIADTYNARIEEFSEAGQFIKTVGTRGTGVGQLVEPTSIALGPSGELWVTDWSNNKVVEFSSAGSYIRQFGTAGVGNGQFSHPDAIAIDPRGNVFVIDQGNNRVQVFDQTSSFVAKFGTAGTGAGQFAFSYPVGIATDANGNIWISDTNHGRIEKWALPNYLPGFARTFGSSGAGNGEFSHPTGVARLPSGNLAVVDELHNRVQLFNDPGVYLGQFGTTGTGNGQFKKPTGIAVDSKGGLWVADSGNHRIEHFNEAGVYLGQFGTAGTGNGQLSEAEGVAVDSKGNLWVADTQNARIEEFTEAGQFVKTVGTKGAGTGQLTMPCGIAVGPGNNVWVTDWTNQKVVEFSEAGTYIRQFGSPGSGNGQFNKPGAIAIDGKGTVWVADRPNARVQGFTQTGEFIGRFGSEGWGVGQFTFSYPMGMTADAKGNIWVSDAENNRVEKFSESTVHTPIGTEIYVDGKLVASKEAWCLSEACTGNQTWTMPSGGNLGTHNVVAKVIDGFGNSASKSLSIDIQPDSSKPELEVGGELANAPEGWVQQEEYGLTASAKDPNGYGLKSIEFKIDGQVKASASQACLDGGCAQQLSRQINMSNYSGGAHSAELVAIDGANNSASKSWTVNVNPEGHISTAEATATLEAVEDTSEAQVLSPEENGPVVEEDGGQISVTDTNVPVQLPSQPGGVASAQVLYEAPFIPVCWLQESEEIEANQACESQAKLEAEQKRIKESEDGAYPGLQEIEITPIHFDQQQSSGEIVGDAAVVYPNAGEHRDGILRPIYDGFLDFITIRDLSASEVYEWEVQLEPGQQLVSTGPQTAEAYFADGHPAMGIRAESAHDAIGSTVPTTLTVSEGNIIKMTVSIHQESPAGGPYVLPIVAGAGWEGGWKSEQREIPSEESPAEAGESRPPLRGVWEGASYFSPPEPVGAEDPEASASGLHGIEKQHFLHIVCSHTFLFSENLAEINPIYEGKCGNPWQGKEGDRVAYIFTMHGKYFDIPSTKVWHEGGPEHDVACIATPEELTDRVGEGSVDTCKWWGETGKGNGGSWKPAGHYIIPVGKAHVTERSSCGGSECNGTPNDWEEFDFPPLVFYLWPNSRNNEFHSTYCIDC